MKKGMIKGRNFQSFLLYFETFLIFLFFLFLFSKLGQCKKKAKNIGKSISNHHHNVPPCHERSVKKALKGIVYKGDIM